MDTTTGAKGPILVMVRGLPGSGKSYVVHELQLQLDPFSLCILDPDAIDFHSELYKNFSKELTNQEVDEKLHPYRYLRAQGYAAIAQNKVIIWNQAFTHQELLDKTIKNLQANAEEHGIRLPAIVVEVNVDLALAKERVHARAAAGGHDVPDDVFERFFNDYKPFTGFGYPIVTLNGTDDVSVSAGKVKAEIDKVRA